MWNVIINLVSSLSVPENHESIFNVSPLLRADLEMDLERCGRTIPQ